MKQYKLQLSAVLILHLASKSLASLHPTYSPALWESRQPFDNQAAAAVSLGAWLSPTQVSAERLGESPTRDERKRVQEKDKRTGTAREIETGTILNQDVDITIALETEIPITHSSGNPTATLLAWGEENRPEGEWVC